MHTEYQGVVTRFLNPNERLILSDEKEMPLVIEADDSVDLLFLKQFLSSNSRQIIEDMAKYGAILLRGFNITSDEEFEQIVLSIPEFHGISEAFMSENGRTPVDNATFVLHTNSVYKTGGTLYLGGFHTENYYSADVPSYLCFYCFQPSKIGGETGLINTEKIYRYLSDEIKEKLEKNTFFVCKWSIAEIARRYQISKEKIEEICTHFNLPVEGKDDDQFVLMYKPSVLKHPLTQEKALQINTFELPTLNKKLRSCFMNDYQGKNWFWHRFFWKLPTSVFNAIEFLAVMFISFFHSPRNSYKIVRTKFSNFISSKKNKLAFKTEKVGSCFEDKDVTALAQIMRQYYSSCLWKEGDVLLVDNKKVMHAGMPGTGTRVIRAMICNPLNMNYSSSAPGLITALERTSETIGACMSPKSII